MSAVEPPQFHGAQLGEAAIVYRWTQLLQSSFSVDTLELPNGMTQYQLHFDVLTGPGRADRLTILFDAAGFERFKTALAAAGTGVQLAQ